MESPIVYAYALLGLSAAGTCAGNLLLKQANLAGSNLGWSAILTSAWFIGAIACYVFDLVLFTQALQFVPVSAAVPIVSGVRIGATAIFAYLIFGEHLTLNQVLASGVIAAGIAMMSRA